jgi:ergothioneine biosynthesis protein EgtB
MQSSHASPLAHLGASLAERYRAIRAQTMALAAPLSAEDCALQSMADTSPVKWHLAHATWFFETFILAPAQTDHRMFDPAYRVLFNSYYHGVGDKHPRPERGMLSRPALDEVHAYRRYTDAAMLDLIGNERLPPDSLALVELGLQHEQQHQELILTDAKHLLSRNPLKPAYRQAGPPVPPVKAVSAGWLRFDGGIQAIGHEGNGFCFDNELPRHRVWLEPFELASRPVNNGEFAEFIADGGYRRPELWLAAGWDRVRADGWHAPQYWHRHESAWHTFTLHGEQALEAAAPVCHISFYEADAFARWAGARLPTEAEWEIAMCDQPCRGNLLESGTLHPQAADITEERGLQQAFGDVWEWTRSDYAPYPGFRPVAGTVGEYNGKFMCGQYVLRGGSCVTPASHIRASYRNFFPPEARWQFSGLRLARDTG